jgi:hypothetical protein
VASAGKDADFTEEAGVAGVVLGEEKSPPDFGNDPDASLLPHPPTHTHTKAVLRPY